MNVFRPRVSTMAKSVRLHPELETRLKEAATAEGVRVSESIRRAIARHCDEVLGVTLRAKLADVTGVVHSTGGRIRRTGEVFKRILRSRARDSH